MSSISYQNTTDPNLLRRKYTGQQVCTFYITDSDGFILDLGGSPINIEILFFDHDDTPQILRQQAILDNFDKLTSSSAVKPTDAKQKGKGKKHKRHVWFIRDIQPSK